LTVVQSTLPTPAPTGITFDSLDLPGELVGALARQGITAPTPVQAAVVPDALAGHDVLGRAQTGSGKTLAFGLPVLARLAGERSRPKHPRALIIVPTRELATQVRRSLEPLANAMRLKLTTVYGGTPYDRQLKQLRNGADIVVATPGRLNDLIDRGACRLDDIAITVLDEADHLCDLGFYPVVDAILGQTPEGGQRLLLSATLDGDVDRLVRKHLRSPKLHELDAYEGSVTTMDHHVMVVGGFRDKAVAATRLVEANDRSIVFTRTREGATELAAAMTEAGIEAVDLHGNLSQRVRERNLHKFSSGKARVVVATDVAARGIHVDGVGLVVHFDTPTDPKAYLHRSGRTARAGQSGAVVTITTPRQVDEVIRLQKRAGVESRHHDIRTAPEPMTAEALAASGETAPAPRRGGGGSAPRRGSGGYRGARESQGGRRPDRTWSRDGGPVRRSNDAGSRPAAGDGARAQREDRPSYRRDRRDDGARPARGERGERGYRAERGDREVRSSTVTKRSKISW
jgi:superfamily II DNA/RNA helicase